MLKEIALAMVLAAVPPPRMSYHDEWKCDVSFVRYLLKARGNEKERPWVAIYGGYQPMEARDDSFRTLFIHGGATLDSDKRNYNRVVSSPFNLPLSGASLSLFFFLDYCPTNLYGANHLLQELVAPIKELGFLIFDPAKAIQFPKLLEHMNFDKMPFTYKGNFIYQRFAKEAA